MTRPLGISTSLLWPQPLVKAMHLLADAGFTLVEVAHNHLLRDTERPCDVAGLTIHAAGRGLQAWSVHLPYGGDYELGNPALDDAELQARYLALLQRCYQMEARQVVFHPTNLSRAEQPMPQTLELAGARLRRLLPECQRFQLGLAIEHTWPNLIGGWASELTWLHDQLGPEGTGICLDFGHANLGGDLLPTLRALRGRLRTTHVHDNHGAQDDHALPGTAAIAWPQVLTLLDETGYAGPMILELAQQEATAEMLSEARQQARRLLDCAG